MQQKQDHEAWFNLSDDSEGTTGLCGAIFFPMGLIACNKTLIDFWKNFLSYVCASHNIKWLQIQYEGFEVYACS